MHSHAAVSGERKMATVQHKNFCLCEFIKTKSATAVQYAFPLCFNIQPPTRKSICRWNHHFEQIGCLSPSFWITLYLIYNNLLKEKFNQSGWLSNYAFVN